MGSCRCTLPPPLPAPKAGEGLGDGAENRSRGKPDDEYAVDGPEVVVFVSDGRDSDPSPDMGASSSANASKEMRSCAFLFGLVLPSTCALSTYKEYEAKR